MPPPSRRPELLAAALDAFEADGYQGASIGRLAEATGLSKAAFTYHFGSKHALALELADPLLQSVERLIEDHELPADPQRLLPDYLELLLTHAAVARWMDGDTYLLHHDELGQRLTTANENMHRLLVGVNPTAASRALASAVLGMFWRPVRNGYLVDDDDTRDVLLRAALSALGQSSPGRRSRVSSRCRN